LQKSSKEILFCAVEILGFADGGKLPPYSLYDASRRSRLGACAAASISVV